MNTFDEIVDLYGRITPLRGARAQCEIKPLGRRKKWWERIQKHSEACYTLVDGSGWGSEPTWFEKSREEKQKAMDSALKHAAIVWERRADGDYIRISKGSEQSIARYKFLQKYLPKGLAFCFSNGQHWVRHGEERHYIPHMPWRAGEVPKYLEFKCLGEGKFERSNDRHLFRTNRVNKAKAKELRPHINKLWDWIEIIMPVLGRDLGTQIGDAQRAIGWKIPIEEATAFLTDENHRRRLEFALVCVDKIGAYKTEYFRITEDRNQYPRTRSESYFAPDEHSKAKLRRYIYRMLDAYDYELR